MLDLIQNATPGTTQRGLLEAPLHPDTHLPFVVVRGMREGPTLLVTAGVHGAEYASIDAAYELADTDPAGLSGTLVVLPVVNPSAFWERRIYVNPIDGRNLNRVFPGQAGGTYAERLAHWIHGEFLSQADALIDLHGGDLVEALEPFSIYVRGHEASRALALAFGLPNVVATDSRGMTLEVTHTHGLPAIIAEASGQGLRPPAEVARLVEGTRRAMRYLGMLAPSPNATPPVTEHTALAWLSSPASGLWHPAVGAGETVNEGQVVGTLRDLTGRDLRTFHAPRGGTVLFVVTSLAMNEGDPLLGIGVPATANEDSDARREERSPAS
ncbi:succinylglutamate desuccinylase/aspartoacylase family protein [Deinococcus apachensis]|uniref:succinylglutamate desuccinylase/aspartoacylase family protein n=1 Tax=Deinococcus apachensis TaxID=309886 RepID=UPI000364AF4A|nr:succinylglutamate desuccinylase/aspartoacylase family protein [Deinococcus apachensis]